MNRLARLGTQHLVAAALASAGLGGHAAPFTPAQDDEVVERLPLSATDPHQRLLQSLRQQLQARPNDAALRLLIARRYFDLVMAQGDPRYIGYARASIGPLATSPPPAGDYWTLKGMLEQYGHAFEDALASFNQASVADARAAEPIAWRAAIYMVQARYVLALAECDRLAALADRLTAIGCAAYARASNGELATASDTLAQALEATPQASADQALWSLTRLAEMAWRKQQYAQAARYFERALKLGVTDQFLLAAYSDFLLFQKKPQEVIQLLLPWERSDVLLLRLALAGQAAFDSRAKAWTDQLRERFAAAARRGDRLHEQEAARFELDLEHQPQAALALAKRNYQTQREPRDAEILLRSALAARAPQAAQGALAWLRESRYEDPALSELASQIEALARPPGVAP